MYSTCNTGAAYRTAIAAAWLVIGVTALGAAAQADEPWEVNHLLVGKPRERTLDSDKSRDVSGITCATAVGFPRI